MRWIEKNYVFLVTYCKRFHPKSLFYEKMKMTTKRIAIFKSFVTNGSFDYDCTFLNLFLVRHSFLEPQPWMNPWPFATCIFTPMNAIGQIAWVARNATPLISNHDLVQLVATQLQFYHNYFSTTMQLLMTTTIMSWWCHFTSIHQNLTHGTMRSFWWFFFE